MNLIKCITIAVFLWQAQVAAAAVLVDPTRPPNTAAAGAEGMPAIEAGPVLQGVSLSSRRKTATISGQEIKVGEKFGEATLIRVGDAEAELRHPDGTREILRLFPHVEKRLSQPARAKAAAGTGKSQP